MLQTKIPKDITKYEGEILFGLSAHNLVVVSIGSVIGILYYLFTKDYTTATMLTMGGVFFGFMGMDRKILPYLKWMRQPGWYFYQKDWALDLEQLAEEETEVNDVRKKEKESK